MKKKILSFSSESSTFHKDTKTNRELEEILHHILGELSPDQVEGLDLDARYLADMGYDPIDHFGGLEKFTQLRELSVAGQDIETWKGLPRLNLLQHLDLSDNELDSLKGAPNLSGLLSLDLSLNHLQNLKYIPRWASLKTLNLGHNQISSLAGLELDQLETLTISGNKLLHSLEPLQRLPNLLSCYALGLLVPQWNWIANSQLKMLSFSPTSSKRVAEMGECDSLRQLSVNLSRCTEDISFSAFQFLETLSITKGKSVSNMIMPESPLTSLSITFCGVQRLPHIPQKSVLHSLDLRFNELTTLPDLTSFPALKDVYLEGNPLGSEVKKQMDVRPSIRWHV